MKNVSKFHLS